MAYEAKSAVYALNSFTWKLLEKNLGWTTYQGVTPIIPTSQQPELMQSGKPFIVYGSAFQPPGHLYALNTESIAYTVYGTSVTEVNKIAQLLWDVFKQQDDAAAMVNNWLSKEVATRGSHRGVYFGTVRATMIDKAEPADEEGGFVSALIMLETRYTADTPDIITAF